MAANEAAEASGNGSGSGSKPGMGMGGTGSQPGTRAVGSARSSAPGTPSGVKTEHGGMAPNTSVPISITLSM